MSDKEYLQNYRKYKDKIYNFFLYRVNFNSALAEDLTSDVFLKAFRHFDSFDPARSFQAWIYRIAHNHLCNHYRAQKRETDLSAAENMGIDPHEQCAASLEKERLIGLIENMESYYREVLLLRFVDGLSNSEIASVLDKEEGAVRTQISRALKTLKEKITGNIFL